MSFETDILKAEAQAQTQADLLAEDAAAKLEADYASVFLGTDAGQRVLADMLTWSKALETTMTGNSWTHYNEGARAMGLRLLKQLGLGGVTHLVALLAKDKLTK